MKKLLILLFFLISNLNYSQRFISGYLAEYLQLNYPDDSLVVVTIDSLEILEGINPKTGEPVHITKLTEPGLIKFSPSLIETGDGWNKRWKIITCGADGRGINFLVSDLYDGKFYRIEWVFREEWEKTKILIIITGCLGEWTTIWGHL